MSKKKKNKNKIGIKQNKQYKKSKIDFLHNLEKIIKNSNIFSKLKSVF